MASEFQGYLTDLFAPLGGVSMQRMFGGLGIRRDGVMFALIVDDVLHFKTDGETAPRYAAEGSEPFSYVTKDGRRTVMSYWRVPERLYDDADAFLSFAREAVGVALRAEARKRPRATAGAKAGRASAGGTKRGGRRDSHG